MAWFIASLPAASLSALGLSAASVQDGFPAAFIPGEEPGDRAFQLIGPSQHVTFGNGGVVFVSASRPLRVQFEGASSKVLPVAGARAPGLVNLIRGADPVNWRTSVPVFQEIVYPDLYAGIDLQYKQAGGTLKSEWRVAPGADPSQIIIHYENAEGLEIDSDGRLHVWGAGGEIRESRPVLYQTAEYGTRRFVDGSFQILENWRVGFQIADYDRSKPLVIDPEVSYATYMGGSGTGQVTGVAVDGVGNLFATGWTEALNFPIAGATQAANAGSVDAFVIKMNPTGDSLIYATYIGGSGDDRAAGIAIDGYGQAYVAGSTGSDDFPLQSEARSAFVGGKEAFALKLNAVGSALVYSTYLGGSNWEQATAIAVDSTGNALVAGDTKSADFITVNAFQGSIGGLTDAFLASLTSSGSLELSSFLGGYFDEHAGGVAVDSAGDVYLAGGTLSSNFPIAAPIQGASGGGMDAFITKVRTSGTPALVYSTYLGGGAGTSSEQEQANAIAVDANGNAFVAGVTSSTDFPVSSGALQPIFNGFRDAFVTKMNAAGTVRTYSTYLGATGFDWATGVSVDASGNAYVAGYTSSGGFAQVNSVQSGFAGLYDAFVSELNPDGNALEFSTMFGGGGADAANAVAVDGNGNIFVGGQTGSFDFPVVNALQASNTGGNTGWLARFGETPPPTDVPSVVSAEQTGTNGSMQEITAVYQHSAGASALTQVDLLLSSTGGTEFACFISYKPGSGTLTLANDDTSSGGTSIAIGSGSAANDQCSIDGAASSASASGNQLTLVVSVTLVSGFPGNNAVYLRARDASTGTGWEAFALSEVISADSVTPSAGSGPDQVFTFAFSDTKGAQNLNAVAVLINTSTNTNNACQILYHAPSGTISLLWDGSNGQDSRPINATSTIYNSQCLVGQASVTPNGNSLILTVHIQFFPAFNGNKNIYLMAQDSTNTGWVQRGTYGVLAGGTPVADSVSPAAGSGTGDTFTFVTSDQGGEQYIRAVAVVFNSTANFNYGCYVVYDRPSNTLSLSYDNASAGSSSLTLGQNGQLTNSQCILNGAGSSVAASGTDLILTLNLQFGGSFAGTQNIYLLAAEITGHSGLQPVGTYTVTGDPPTVNSMSPASGGGESQTFFATVTDSLSSVNISGVDVLVSTGGTANACYVMFDRSAGTIGLYDDAGGSVTSKPLGSSATLQNSQCAIGYSAYSTSGKSLTLQVGVLFKVPDYAGAKTTYVRGRTPAAQSSFVSVGNWTVPGGAPMVDQVTPSSGSGSFQQFAVQVSDSVSGESISAVQFALTAIGLANSCYVVLNRVAGTVGLYSDDLGNISTKPIGSSATLENTQCAVGYSGVNVSGTALTFDVQLLLKSAFTGTKSMMAGAQTSYASSGWVAAGSWIVP